MVEYVDETPRRPRRSRQEAAAEQALGHHWVTLIGYEGPVARYPGDNSVYWPMHVEMNADWRQSGVFFDRQQPAHRAVRYEVIGCQSKAAAEALKGALDECLTGVETHAGTEIALRHHRFRNVAAFGDFSFWWPLVLSDAIMRAAGGVVRLQLFSRAEHEEMVQSRAARRMERAAEWSGW